MLRFGSIASALPHALSGMRSKFLLVPVRCGCIAGTWLGCLADLGRIAGALPRAVLCMFGTLLVLCKVASLEVSKVARLHI